MSENVTEFLLSKLVASERTAEDLAKQLAEKTNSMLFWYDQAKQKDVEIELLKSAVKGCSHEQCLAQGDV